MGDVVDEWLNRYSNITKYGGTSIDVKIRIHKARARHMACSIACGTLPLKKQAENLQDSELMSVLVYSCKTWKVTQSCKAYRFLSRNVSGSGA